MTRLSPEQEKEILAGKPVGTFALLVVYAAMTLAGWLLLYFGRYLSLGAAS